VFVAMFRLRVPTDLQHLNYDFCLSALNGHSLTAHNDVTRALRYSRSSEKDSKREETAMQVMALALHISELY
jgi:hypothetical protein